MKYQVLISASAEQDVDRILAWFREQSATVAGGRWMRELLKRVTTLEMNPERCTLASESEDIGREIRELLFGKRRGRYRILFEIRGRKVLILRLWHGARGEFTDEDMPT
ncbi:MAG: type II toxin-antitoxin system RelE/ParE family toxin [Planctomycetota bacterium]|nr:type II toxin-antitoxin system RelE/ParE family toxin [Planctomycetota bacterium]